MWQAPEAEEVESPEPEKESVEAEAVEEEEPEKRQITVRDGGALFFG